jgi:hypothetical protein
MVTPEIHLHRRGLIIADRPVAVCAVMHRRLFIGFPCDAVRSNQDGRGASACRRVAKASAANGGLK